jgi:hypothetical protein
MPIMDSAPQPRAAALPVRVLPAGLGVDAAGGLLVTSAGADGMLLAGHDAASGDATLILVRGETARRLWPTDADTGAETIDDAAAGTPTRLATLSDGTALALMDGGPLLALRPGGRRLHPSRVPRPDALLSSGAGPGLVALCYREGALWALNEVDSITGDLARRANRRAANRIAAPALSADQVPHFYHVSHDFGRLFGANDPVAGFALWRQVPEGWQLLADRGLHRYGMNAVLDSAIAWQGQLVLTANTDSLLEREVPNLAVSGELLALSGDTLGLCCGEIRIGPRDLIVPSLRPDHPLLMARQNAALEFESLGTRGDALILLTRDRLSGHRQLFALWADGTTHRLSVPGRLCALVQGPEGAFAVTETD